MKALIIGDIHLSDRPPSIRMDSYADEILEKLALAVQVAVDQGVDLIISAGDVFHIKSPSRTSHALVQRTAEALTRPGLPVRIVPGNHDMQHDRVDSLVKQPLGTLAKMTGIELLLGPDTEFPIFGLPYLWDWKADLPTWMRMWHEYPLLHRHNRLMVTHAPIFPPGESAIYEYISATDWAEQQEMGYCYYGHIHDLHGQYTVHTSSGGMVEFCNQGALSRGSLHEATLKRKPAVTLYDDSAVNVFTRIEIPHKPAEEVFKLAEKLVEDTSAQRLDDFLQSVSQTTLSGLTLEEVIAHAEKMNLKPLTLSVIREVVEDVMSR